MFRSNIRIAFKAAVRAQAAACPHHSHSHSHHISHNIETANQAVRCFASSRTQYSSNEDDSIFDKKLEDLFKTDKIKELDKKQANVAAGASNNNKDISKSAAKNNETYVPYDDTDKDSLFTAFNLDDIDSSTALNEPNSIMTPKLATGDPASATPGAPAEPGATNVSGEDSESSIVYDILSSTLGSKANKWKNEASRDYTEIINAANSSLSSLSSSPNVSANGPAASSSPAAPTDQISSERKLFGDIFQDILSNDGSGSASEGTASKNSAKYSPEFMDKLLAGVGSGVAMGDGNGSIRGDQSRVGSRFILGNEVASSRARQEQKVELAQLVSTALLPSIHYIKNEIATDYELNDFITQGILKRYSSYDSGANNNDSNSSSNSNSISQLKKDHIAKIEAQSKLNPSEPIVNDLTLSVLLKASFEALYENFQPSIAINDILTIFETIKKTKPIELFAYGCDIEVYNFLMSSLWQQFRDFSIIESLIFETKMNGILSNQGTIEVLTRVSKEGHALLSGSSKDESSLSNGQDDLQSLVTDENEAKLLQYMNDEFELNDNKPNSKVWNLEDYNKLQLIDKLLINMMAN